MPVAPLLTLALQVLEPSPAQVEIGDEVRVRWIGEEEQEKPSVEMRAPTGDVQTLGAAGEDLRIIPQHEGIYELSAELTGGRRIVAVFHARPAQRRWLYGLVLGPIGLWLLVGHTRSFMRRRPSQPAP